MIAGCWPLNCDLGTDRYLFAICSECTLEPVTQPPGTVSKILWHFTGGPKWNTTLKRQEKRRKPEGDAYSAFLSILTDKKLELGQYREVVRVRIPQFGPRNKKTGKRRVLKYTFEEMQSSPVCCLSDIPIAHLSYQAKRYGRIAIGFHRDSVVGHGFNPVFYTLHHTLVLQSIHQSFKQLDIVKANSIFSNAEELESKTSGLECEHGHEIDSNIGWEIDEIKLESADVDDAASSAQDNLEEFLAFVKTFGPSEFSSIYCEREWRATEPFSFSDNDVAMIVLPKKNAGYFNNFVSRRAKRLGLPRSIPIVPWEDLIEH